MTSKKESRVRPRAVDGSDGGMWRRYSTAEDNARTNRHYDLPAEFITTITGGDWRVYSCNLWEGAASVTESQERKLDLLADLLQLQPGQRVLDVGCGWGGPLIYLAQRYGVKGVGLTLSPTQKDYADHWIKERGVDVAVHVCHWRDFEDTDRFDAAYTDEVIVHFNDLLGFFQQVKKLLKPDGRMLNKEVHFTSTHFMQPTRTMIFVNEVFGETGNYLLLAEELALLDQAGFRIEQIQQMSVQNYVTTLDGWFTNMQAHRQELETLVGNDVYQRFRIYLRIARQNFRGPSKTLDMVVARPLA
ncbi:MAG: class I SAM-dependent methyltransferase [Dehalococcoidia bacterium]